MQKGYSVISIRVPQEIRSKIEKLAGKKGIVLSEYVRWLIMEHVADGQDILERRKRA